VPPEVDTLFEGLLDYVRDNRGFDFTGYKRASLMRRVRKRMHEVGIEGFGDYQDYLEVHPDEFTTLFNTILINVTSFFREPGAWEFLAREILPQIVDRKGTVEPVRLWSVGCASGEEAYTVAMVVAEAVGLSRLAARVKIYATDVDEDALAQARSGAYSAEAVQAIPDELQKTYLEPANGGFTFKKDLRRAVIFGRHDLVKDAPISHIDLIVCRNTLMYFNADVQSRIYKSFHFALAPTGYLFLGKSEMLLTRTNIFVPVDLKLRVFARVPPAGGQREPAPEVAPRMVDTIERLRQAVFESAKVAQVVLDTSGALVAANTLARSQFALGDPDLGRPFHNLELSFRPLELRSRLERATAERRSNMEAAVPWRSALGDQRYLDIEVVPIGVDGNPLGTSVTFTDVSGSRELQAELERSRRELETAYEEIQSTVEELETTNEELQSTNEELETTNEELQSTNEELETMNEELQSTNEELETINAELGQRTEQLNQVNVFFESILGSLSAGVIVLDRDLTVESWNQRAEDLWGIRAGEARQKNLFALEIGLPVERLRKPIRDALAGNGKFTELTVDATNRRGQAIRCKVSCSPMKSQDGERHGVIVLMEQVEP
jgi:two-component system CheB/CheR fusion protein